MLESLMSLFGGFQTALTPPVGSCLFAAVVIGDTPLEKIAKNIVTFLLAEIAVLVLVIFCPPLSTALISLMGGGG